MALAAFDIHQFIKTLKKAGLPEAQAEAVSIAVRESHEAAELTTRQDVAALEQRIDSRFELLFNEIKDLRKDVDAKYELLRKDTDAKYELLRKDVDAKYELLRKDTDAKYELLRKDVDTKHEFLLKDTDAKYELLRKDMDTQYEFLRKEIKEASLRQIIWLGSIVFLLINTGPILPKLLHLS